jgi:hypothetical protein
MRMRRIWPLCTAALFVAGALSIADAQGGGGGRGGGGAPPPAPPGSSGILGPTNVSMGTPAAPIEEGTSAISGVVIDGSTKTPLADAVVYLGLNGIGVMGTQNRQVTDAKGRFAFVNLPAKGNATVSASKIGFLPGGFSRDNRPVMSNAPINLRDGEWIGDVQIPLWRPGGISGTVTDERGEPVVGVFVRVIARLRIAGQDVLGGGPLTRTDDRGMYRVTGLGPGRYVVVVPSVQSTLPTASVLAAPPRPAGAPPYVPEPALDLDPQTRLVLQNHPIPPPPSDGVRFAYPIAFHPNTTSLSSAATIDLNYGDERGNVDVTLQPVTSWRVSGVVQGPPEALANLTLRLIPQGFERLGYGSEAGTAFVGVDGQFTFLHVPDGTYSIEVIRSVNQLRASSATMPPIRDFPPPPRPGGGQGWGTNTSSVDAAPPGVGYERRTFGASSGNYIGRTTITVSGRDEHGVALPLRPTGTMTGRVRVESTIELPPGTTRQDPGSGLRLDPADGDPARGPLQREGASAATPSGEFTIAGLMPGPYFLRGNPTWLIKSVTWQGRDYTDTPFDATATQDFSDVEVVVTDAKPTLTGIVRDTTGKPAAGAVVVAFSTNDAHWTNRGLTPIRMSSSTTSRTGAYQFPSLPAGEYFVVHVDPAQYASRFEPEFFRTASAGAARVTLGWGETRSLDLSAK